MTEERFNELSNKPVYKMTPEELIEINSVKGKIQVGNIIHAIKLCIVEDRSEDEIKVAMNYPGVERDQAYIIACKVVPANTQIVDLVSVEIAHEAIKVCRAAKINLINEGDDE